MHPHPQLPETGVAEAGLVEAVLEEELRVQPVVEAALPGVESVLGLIWAVEVLPPPVEVVVAASQRRSGLTSGGR